MAQNSEVASSGTDHVGAARVHFDHCGDFRILGLARINKSQARLALV
jgi:hypothetical protein